MSGRPKRPHRRGFDGRQVSNRYTSDPPPRFANRQRNGDGRFPNDSRGSSYEYYEDQGRGSATFSPHKGGRQHSSGRSSYDELIQLVSKLEQSTDVDGSCHLSRQILDFLELHATDYRTNQMIARNADGILKTFQQVILDNVQQELLNNLEQCVGRMGHCLGRDAQRLFEWIFLNVHMEDASDDTRAVYLRGLHEVLCQDGGKSTYGGLMPFVVDNVQTVLEVAETPVLLEAVVKNITTLAKYCPQLLAHHFKNTVDILVGWHIDIQQDPTLIEFIAAALTSLHEFWIKDMLFSIELLKQFLEDMEAYSNELAGVSDDLSVPPEESSTPEQCLAKLVALIKVFTTVLKALGTSFCPSRCPDITPAYVQNVVARVVNYVLSANDVTFSEELLIVGNQCLQELCRCLQNHFAASCPDLVNFVIQQFDEPELFSADHTLSVIKLLMQVVEELQSSLPTQFVQQIFSVDSPLLQLRYSSSSKLLSKLVKLYQSVLAIRNIPIVETTYKLIISDLNAAFRQLDNCCDQPLSRLDGESAYNPLDVQAAAIFDLTVLSQLSNTCKAVIGMWSPKPSVFSLLVSRLTSLSPIIATEYPAVHFALLYALFQDCRSNGYYVPSSASVSMGTTSIGPAHSSSGTVEDILAILTKQMQAYTLPFDICHLIQRWVDYLTAALGSANRKTLPLERLQPFMDGLACQLLAFTFSREHSIRLENAAVLKAIFQSGLVSDKAIMKCVPECLMRLCDTHGEIRAAYSALLEVIPTHVVTCFAAGVDTFHPPNGHKGLEGLRNCKGTWHSRHVHMTKQSQVTFHGHHFKAILGFIMHGYAPSKHLPDDWLERMYHSCQHRHPPIPESLDHPELHPLLMSRLVGNCDSVLWFWATYESAQYCLLARLRTPLGMPADTFTALENVLRGYAQEVESHDSRHLRDTPSSFSGHMGAGLGPRHYTVLLRAVLLLQFMEHLDKLMYNAYEGSCVTLPPVPKSVRTFFRKNMDTCLEWLSHVRGYIVSIAIHAGMPAVAIRHGFAALKDLVKSHSQSQTPEFWKMLVNVVHAMLLTGSWEAIRGMGVWVKQFLGVTPPWIVAAEADAKSSYETASEEYIKALDLLHSPEDHELGPTQRAANAPIIKLIVNRVVECYICVSEWKEVEAWHSHVTSLQEQHARSAEFSHAFHLHYDINQIGALRLFEDGDLSAARDNLESQSDSQHGSRDPEVYPLWDPSQLLVTSQLLLMKAATHQAGEDGSGSDDATSVNSEGEYGARSCVQRWLKLSSAYAESPLRVGCLEWPLRVSSAHALQLQVAAALRALNPIKSRHVQPALSGLLLFPTPSKSLNPSRQNTGIWSEALRISSYLSSATTQADFGDHTPSLLLEVYRLARKQGNLKHAKYLIQRQILNLTGAEDVGGEIKLTDAVDQLNTSSRIPAIEKLRVMRELSKMHTSRGQSTSGMDLLSLSLVNYCHSQKGVESTGFLRSGNDLTARSLLTVVKWLQADSRLMQTVWTVDLETGRRLQSLLDAEYECRRSRMGLYQSTSAAESFDLFRPDESVARFDKHEYAVGQLLHLATIHSPELAKAWWSLAGWCYRIGRKNLEALGATGTAELLDHERQEVDRILGDLVTPEQHSAVLGVLGQVHISEEMAEGGDLKAKEQIKHVDMEEDSKSLKGQLLSVCPTLEMLPSLDDLLTVWQGVRVRMFMHYQLAARAYFTFLKLSGSQAGSSPGLDDMNVTATLRLLRLLVKYAGELKSELESGFACTPTKPWKGIIPQLFSRLNHPETNVRESVSDLLCRVGHDSPHFIIYPAIVGASRRAEKKTTTDSGLLPEEGEGRENENGFDMGSRDLITEEFSPPDASGDQDEQAETSPVELTNLEKSLSVIIDSLKQQNATMVKAVQDLVSELCRITLLWDEMWLAALMQRQGEVHRRLMQIDQEMRRTMTIQYLSSAEKEAILREKYLATMRPLLWVLEHLAAVTAQPPETPNERNFQAQYSETINSALQRLRSPTTYASPHNVWEPFKEFQQMLMHRAQKRMQNSLSLHEISPHLAAISSSSITMPGHNQDDEPVTLESFQLEVAVLPTKTKPKKISMIGSDGRKHTYLFKGLEDLHLDERIMQFMAIINNMFARAHKHQTQLYQARDYAVIPLGARSGLIQWVDAVTPLFGIYKRWQQREAYAKALEQEGSQQALPVPIQVLKPNELFYSKIIPLLKEQRMSEQTPRKDWPHTIQLRVLKELLASTPGDLLAKELWCACTCASEWWSVTQTYSRSTAVMCMIGYIIGLGDRHLDNLLVEFSTGQVVHVDYNVCFEKGRSLRVPERVPFRMTQNIENALGFTGVEGLFRISCEDILKILRRGRETLLTLLEAFVYDPLVDWTQSEDAAFPLAVKATVEQGRLSRKEMEREVASGMLVTRLAESGPHWQRNRETLCSVLLALELHLDEIAKIGEKLAAYHDITIQLDRKADIFREALSSPDHPLISMQDTLSEQSRLLADRKKLTTELQQKYQEFQEWNQKYKASFFVIHGTAGLGALITHMQNPLELGPPGHEPAVEFLQSIHQNQTVETCDQLEDELLALLQKRRTILSNALDALHQYRSITSQFHADYLKQSRSYLWVQCLEPALESELSHDSLRQVTEEFELRLATGSKSGHLIKAVDSRFRKHIQELHLRYTKLLERSKSLSHMDVNGLEGNIINANKQLRQFCQENLHDGPPALACFIIIALCPLSRRWLFMEQTAQAARDRLSDLTSRDGDWFLDELYTMSGNVSQMVGLLDMCLTEMGHDVQPGSVMRSTIEAIQAVHRVYVGMQDLFNKFQSLVLPEALNYLLSEEESMLEMLENITKFSLTMYPTLSIQEALRTLAKQLRECSLKSLPADLAMTAAVEEMRNKLSTLLVTSDRDTPQTPAQVILNSMNGLFQMSESATQHMLEAMEEIDIPDFWENIDLIKQTEGLMCTTASLPLTEELLFVRKAQAIVDFCLECRNLLKAFKLDISPPEDHSTGFNPPTPPGTPSRKQFVLHVPSESILGLPIRHYISETLICHVLGQPSHSLACCLISAITQYLGIPLPNRQMPMEDVCKLANDHYQNVLPMTIIQQARTLFSQHDVSWRDCDKARRLMTNLDNCKHSVQRTRGITARFQWLHEESLILPDSHYPWVGPQRSMLLTTIKKVLSEQMVMSLTSVLDKINSQQFRISQRLQWAAGANPALNTIVDEFERAMNRRKQILQEEEDLYLKIYECCEAVIHLESSHTRIPAQTNSDKEVMQLLHRCADVMIKLQLCTEQLSQVSGIMPHIELPEDGGPLTIQWMQTRLEQITMEQSKILNEKRSDNTKLAKHKESVLSELEKLRGLNRAHRKLMVEIWQHLTALARLEDPPLPGQVQPGPRGFISLQNKFGEETRSFIQSTQELIASDMSLAKPTWTSKARAEEFAYMRNAAGNLRGLAESLLGQLLSFTDQLFQGQPCGNLKWNSPPSIERELPQSRSTASIASQVPGQQPTSEQEQQQQQQTKIYRSSQGVMRDKRTGKALQEQNSYAVGVWRRVKAKLDGRDPDPAYRMTAAEQVKYIIDEATSPDNLCQLYEGWTPWV